MKHQAAITPDIGPPERAQHQTRYLDRISEIDPDTKKQTVKTVLRSADLPMRLFKNGSINESELEAARRVTDDGYIAGLVGVKCMSFELTAAGTGEKSDRVYDAKERIWGDMEALGSGQSVAAQVYYWVMVQGAEFEDLPQRLGRTLCKRGVKGVLVSALGIVARNRGLLRKKGG